MTTERVWPHTSVTHARAEHGYLDALLDETKRAVHANASFEQTQRAILHFVEALTKHLEREETSHFPSLQTLHSEYAIVLKNFLGTHTQLRSQMQTLQDCVHDDALEDASETLDALDQMFKSHEAAEEDFFSTLAS